MLDASTRRVPEGALELPSTARGQVAELPRQALALLLLDPSRQRWILQSVGLMQQVAMILSVWLALRPLELGSSQRAETRSA